MAARRFNRTLWVQAAALVFANGIAAVPFPAPAPSGCAGETWSVFITQEHHRKDTENGPGNYSATGFKRNDNATLTLTAHFTSALRDGKMRWVSRNVSWIGYSTSDVPQCQNVNCVASGYVELGPSEYSYSAMTDEQAQEWKEQSKWQCREETTGNCFGYFPYEPQSVTFPALPSRSDLRDGFSYTKEDGETRTSVIFELRGNEQLTIDSNPSIIVPNQTVGNDHEATSQLAVKLTCDGAPLKNHQVGLRIDVSPHSGGHIHLGTSRDPRPRGKLTVGLDRSDCGGDTGKPDDSDCKTIRTNENGEAQVKFESPLTGSTVHSRKGGPYESGIAGRYRVTASSREFTPYGAIVSVAQAYTDILAQVDGLQPLQKNGDLDVGGGGAAHPQNSYGTPKTLQAFSALAADFHREQDRHNTDLAKCGKSWLPLQKVSANDIALPDGGIFDIGREDYPFWGPSHQTHSKGEGGDFNRFGAKADDSGLNFHVEPSDCNGGTAIRQYWYAHLLLDLGTKYGHWDCTDLNGRAAWNDPAAIAWNPLLLVNGAVNMSACEAGETQDQKGGYSGQKGAFSDPTYFPNRLHLHVDD